MREITGASLSFSGKTKRSNLILHTEVSSLKNKEKKLRKHLKVFKIKCPSLADQPTNLVLEIGKITTQNGCLNGLS